MGNLQGHQIVESIASIKFQEFDDRFSVSAFENKALLAFG